MLAKILHRVVNEPLVIVGVVVAAVDVYDGEPSGEGIGGAVVTGPLTKA